MSPRAHLVWGEPQNGHPEGWIVGNREGLNQLREACEVALRDGQFDGDHVGDFEGVMLSESGWDSEGPESSGWFAIGCFSLILATLGLLVLGIRQVVLWIIG